MVFNNGSRNNSLVSLTLLAMSAVTTQFSDLLIISTASANDGIHLSSASYSDRLGSRRDGQDLSHHLRRLDEMKMSQDIFLRTANAGYFYAEYYSKVNCSTGTGTISYVEGYSAGICLPLQTIAGVQSGSMVQTCHGGLYLTVQYYSSKTCVGIPIISNYSMNVCAASTSKYGSSVSVKCSTDPTTLPLSSDALVESAYGISTTPDCISYPMTFKAFLKSQCYVNQYSGATGYFYCQDKVTYYQLNGAYSSACSTPLSFSNSTYVSGTCSAAATMAGTIPSAGLYSPLKGTGAACNARCATFLNDCSPTGQPTSQPTGQPSRQPIAKPTTLPSGQPTALPSSQPTSMPTGIPSGQPSSFPSSQPSGRPTVLPSGQHTMQPTRQPTGQPTSRPTSPTKQPTGQPTGQPSMQPTSRPTTHIQISKPSTPTGQPTGQPSSQPSRQPTGQPTGQPTSRPSTYFPSSLPTLMHSALPSKMPSGLLTGLPTEIPSSQPTGQPSGQPTQQPSHPTRTPTRAPTGPTKTPTRAPSAPTSQPTSQPSAQPTTPSSYPTSMPSNPSSRPSTQPTSPTGQPTTQPTSPTGQPTGQPSRQPTGQPTSHPSHHYTPLPSSIPTCRVKYTACIASCPVIPSYPVFESYRQFSCFGYITPTAKPTQIPTPSPTAIPGTPTQVPTTQTTKVVQITQSISGVTVAMANSTSFILAYKTAVAASLGGGITVDNIQISQFKSISGLSGRRLLASGVAIVSYVTAANTDLSTISTSLNAAITSGTFTASLVNSGYPAASASTTANVIDDTTFSPSFSPVGVPEKKTEFAISSILGIAVGGFVGLCVLSFVIYCVTCRGRKGYSDSDYAAEVTRGARRDSYHQFTNITNDQGGRGRTRGKSIEKDNFISNDEELL